MYWIIDNGHGEDTKGKRSPDGKLMEYEFNRWIAKELTFMLKSEHLQYQLLVPELTDKKLIKSEYPHAIITDKNRNLYGLRARVKRVNHLTEKHDNCIVVSIHGNAHGMGNKWMPGNGIETFAYNSDSPSYPVAKIFQKNLIHYTSLRDRGVKFKSFYILKYTKCLAIITENGFYTHKDECKLMKNCDYRYGVSLAHFEAIKKVENISNN